MCYFRRCPFITPELFRNSYLPPPPLIQTSESEIYEKAKKKRNVCAAVKYVYKIDGVKFVHFNYILYQRNAAILSGQK